MIVLIDNYDSFTYNLVQRIGEIDPNRRMKVYRNDKVTVDQIEQDHPQHIIISPGPCTPREGGISNDVNRHFAGTLPLLGVCLGHQCIHHDGKTIYAGLSNPFVATRYHSLTVDPDTLSSDFQITARTEQGELMGIRHKTMPIEGVQFHPESFLTTEGHKILANFLAA